jgi:hypothetical protein
MLVKKQINIIFMFWFPVFIIPLTGEAKAHCRGEAPAPDNTCEMNHHSTRVLRPWRGMRNRVFCEIFQ